MKAHVPVVCVVVWCICSGVHIITNQPVKILVAANADLLHFLMGDIRTICVEIPQDHYVLEDIRNGLFSTNKSYYID